MSTRKICFVSPTAYGYFDREVEAVGGGDRQLSMVSRGLAGEFDVHFVVGEHGQPKTEQIDGVTLHSSYEPKPRTNLVENVGKFVKIFRAMRRADADIYMYCGHPRKAAFLYAITKMLGKKWIYYLANDPNVEEHPAELTTPVRKLFEWSLYDADSVVAQTEKQRRLLADVYDLDARVIPSGYEKVDDVLPVDQREFFLWVGRIRRLQKRPDRFLDAAERLPDEEFALIGPRSVEEGYCDEIERRAEELTNVRYLGRVSEERLHDHYRRAKALVNTSDYEGFPSTFLEAWRYRTPVVSYTVGVGRFFGSESDPACADGDFEEFERLLSRTASDPAYRKSLVEPAYEYFEENLTLEAVTEEYRDLLSTL